MSWGEYITNLQGQGLKQAVIAGQDGSWIQSSDAAVSIKLFVFSLQSLYCYLVHYHSGYQQRLVK